MQSLNINLYIQPQDIDGRKYFTEENSKLFSPFYNK